MWELDHKESWVLKNWCFRTVVLEKTLENPLDSKEIKLLLEEINGTPLQYSCLENPVDGGARKAAVNGVAKDRTRLSNFTFTFHFHALEKEMATHSSVLAWRIPGMGEPGGLLSMGSHRVRHDWSDLAAAAAEEINPEYSLEWPTLMLKLQYFGHLMGWADQYWKRPWCWERLKTRGQRHNRDKMVRWYHRLNGHEFEPTPGDGGGQGSLACCSPWGCKELGMT